MSNSERYHLINLYSKVKFKADWTTKNIIVDKFAVCILNSIRKSLYLEYEYIYNSFELFMHRISLKNVIISTKYLLKEKWDPVSLVIDICLPRGFVIHSLSSAIEPNWSSFCSEEIFLLTIFILEL